MSFNAGVPNRLDIKFYGTLLQQKIINTFTYTITQQVAEADFEALALALSLRLQAAGQLVPKFLDCCPSNYMLDEIGIQCRKEAQAFYQKFFTVAVAGGWGSAGSTANLSAVIVRRGDAANRKNVSTLHVPSPTLADVMENGSWKVGYKVNLDALATSVKDTVTFTVLGVGAFNIDPAIPNGRFQAAVTPITMASPRLTVRVMGRRTVGRGI